MSTSRNQGRSAQRPALALVRCIRATAIAAALLALGCAGEQPAAQAPTPTATQATQPEPVAAAAAAAPAPAPAAPAAPPAPDPNAAIIVKEGLQTPESVLYDAEADVYLVSNINGSPLAADDNGYITKLAPDGKVLEAKWIDGAKDNVQLNAPKGMAIADGVLYVSDIDTVRKFDAKTGEPKGEIAIKGASFLNDIAAGADGTIYVTDSGLKMGQAGLESNGGDAVYKIVKDKAKALIKGKDLKGPNGVLVDDAGVWVVTFGANELYNVKSGKKTDLKALPKGGLDGIVKTSDGKLLVSSWESKQVFKGSPSEDFTPVLSDLNSPADIGYDTKRNRVLVPQLMDNVVVIKPL
jgi:sugar lactone lactonase YvrE